MAPRVTDPRTGIVFDVREFTVHDGPGIRTTVFLKGCPLRCAWCHNPEGLIADPQILRSPGGQRQVGVPYRSDELAALLNRQAPVLRNHGGVTFSGGEPLAQAAFVAEVIDQLDGLHVVLGTSGQANPEEFRLVASRADLVLFDVKLIDNAQHVRWTGMGNEGILANLRTLSGMGKPFVIRVPLVPGVTDTDENLQGIARLVSGLELMGDSRGGPGARPPVELLPYNRAAGGKYAACGMSFRPGFDESQAPNPNTACFEAAGLKARVL